MKAVLMTKKLSGVVVLLSIVVLLTNGCVYDLLNASKEVSVLRSAIEATGRFGKERDVNKRDGGLAMCVRIVEQEWHTKKAPPSPYETCYLQIETRRLVKSPNGIMPNHRTKSRQITEYD